MERFFFKKLDLWVVLLVAMLLAICAWLFAAMVRHYYTGGDRLGSVGPIISEIAAFPATAKNVVNALLSDGKADLRAIEQRFPAEKAGFTFNYAPGSRPDLGYVLANRYDADLGNSVAELWDLDRQEMVASWGFSGVDRVWRRSSVSSVHSNPSIDRSSRRFRAKHSLLLGDGSLLTQDSTPLLKVGRCSELALFRDDAIYHHSIEVDGDGGFWVSSYIEPKTVDIGSTGFVEDGIVKLSPTGAVLFERSVVQMLDRNGLGYLIYGHGPAHDDPIHLNDIEPVLADGPYWRKGDVFLSLRNLSLVLLYRPASDEVLWFKQGPWLHQHDVNIVDPWRISVFNNNAALTQKSSWMVRGTNDVVLYDFRTGEVSSPWKAGFDALQIRTRDQGRGTVVGEEVFVEETNFGRMAQFDKKGAISWQYVNRAADGRIYFLAWSRLVDRGLGDRVGDLFASGACG
jgi:hypothetical protein